MTIFDTKRQRAAWLIAILGVLLLFAFVPYASGLFGAPVLYVILAPLHQWLVRRVKWRGLASTIVIVVAIVGIVIPITWVISLLVGQAQEAAREVIASPVMSRLDDLHIAGYAVGQELRQMGSKLVSLMGGGAISLLGKVTRITLNMVFAFFGLYYILQNPDGAWRSVRPYIPFSDENVEILRERFGAVTKSTVIGTGASAVAQAVMVGVVFALLGLGNSVFWGAVTLVLSILPVVGSGLVWGPGAIVLATGGQTGKAVALVLIGALLIGNVDNLIRPWVSNRYAQIHPLITLVGAIAGVSWLGILGLLIGPLALSYFFELLAMYKREYLTSVA
ncbi:MAG TPA: AI-2E family transporter [Gemmatimonadales bacterium]|nr:AI-2E family transporter [Gemmatimonadales bacterium]